VKVRLFVCNNPFSAIPFLGHIVAINVQSRPVFYENHPSDKDRLMSEESIPLCGQRKDPAKIGIKINRKNL